MKHTFRLTEARPDVRRDVSDEIRFHLDMRTQELIDQGMSAEEALREARRQFGDVASIEAECRDERRARTRERGRREWWRGLAMDLRYAVRSLRTNVGFTLAAVLTLGLGIGAAAAVFTVVDGVLLRPLPYADPSRLAMVWISSAMSQGGGELPLSSGLYVEARDAVKGLSTMAAFRSWPFVLSGESNAEPEQIAGARTEPSLFSTLGVRPVLGQYRQMQQDPHFRDYLLFHEYFHGDNGRGVGASHQTGWTGLVAKLLQPRSKAAAADALAPTQVS